MNDIQIIKNDEMMLATMESQMKFSEVVCKSGLCPAGLNTAEKVFVAVQWGKELGLSPMVAVNNVAVINGKPSLSTDAMHAIAKSNPAYNGCEWVELTDKAAECILHVRHNGYTEDVRSRYTIEDAEKADLLKKDNWKKYPMRMLKHRCLSYALRDAFPELLSGIYTTEELNGDDNIRDITPPQTFDDFDVTQPPKIAKPKDGDDF